MEASVAVKPFAEIGQHISHSQVSMFDKCQLAWLFKYVKGITKPPTVQMLLGQCYHKALALNFTQKRITGIDLPANDVVLHFTTTFDEAVSRGEIDAAPGLGFDSYRDPVARLLRHYYESYVIDKMEPILSEHEVTCSVPDCDRVFAGIIDVQLSDGTIIDFKVSARRRPDSEISQGGQANAYAMLCGWNGAFEFHVGLRANAKPAIQIVRTQRTGDDVDAYVQHLREVVTQMNDLEQGRADPVPYTGFCSEKICQYYAECQDWKYGGLAFGDAVHRAMRSLGERIRGELQRQDARLTSQRGDPRHIAGGEGDSGAVGEALQRVPAAQRVGAEAASAGRCHPCRNSHPDRGDCHLVTGLGNGGRPHLSAHD